ncbi:hypothetical protein RA268_27640 [Pseudomonas syringae pv. tagetis]
MGWFSFWGGFLCCLGWWLWVLGLRGLLLWGCGCCWFCLWLWVWLVVVFVCGLCGFGWLGVCFCGWFVVLWGGFLGGVCLGSGFGVWGWGCGCVGVVFGWCFRRGWVFLVVCFSCGLGGLVFCGALWVWGFCVFLCW